MLKLVNKYSNVRNVFLTRLCAVGLSSSSAESTPSTPTAKEANINEMNTQSRQHPSRPANLKDAKLTNVIESKEEFEKYVKRILPSFLIPDPPKHESYPTPSGWVPPDYQRCTKLPYYVLRTRFHQYPIYPEERDGSKRYVRIKNIEGDIWQFERDLRKHVEECIRAYENKSENVYAQVNEIQRHVLVKGYYQEYINDFFLKCGF